MNILMIGDVVGRPGRNALKKLLPKIQQEAEIHFTVVNGENGAGGNGLTKEILDEILDLKVDVVTSGNHIWDKKEIIGFIDNEPRLLRPGNYPTGAPGRWWGVYDSAKAGISVGVINLSGRVYMPELDCPFHQIDHILPEIKAKTPIVIVDFHAEATSEKNAFAWHLDGRVTALAGTHTHVQTADERILPDGTAYITDLGMTGPRDSVIGVKKEIIINKFLTGMPARFEVASGDYQLNGIIVKVEIDTGKAIEVKRINCWQRE